MSTTPDVTTDPAEPDLSARELLHRVYALFYNKRVGLGLILAMGLLCLLGVLFVQAPADVKADPERYKAFLESVKGRYGGWTQVLSTLGIFTMFSSIAFTVVTALLALSIIACTTHRLPQLWRQATKPHLHVREEFFDHARTRSDIETTASTDALLTRAEAELKKHRYRIVRDEGAPGSLYADRNRWAPFGTAAAHLAFVLILLGMVVTGHTGFREDNLVVPVGGRVPVGHGTNLEVEATNFTSSFTNEGRPLDYASDLTVYQNGQKLKSQTVRVNNPLTAGGVRFNQASYGIAADVEIKVGNDTVRRTVPLQFSSPDEQDVYGTFDLPAQGLQVYVLTAASGASSPSVPPGQALIELYSKDQKQAMASKRVKQGEPVTAGDITMTFHREQQYTALMASRDYGAPIVWAAAPLLVLGTILTMFLRHHRIWLRVEDGEDGARLRMGSPDRHDSIFERHFAALANEIAGKAAVTDATDPAPDAADSAADADDTPEES